MLKWSSCFVDWSVEQRSSFCPRLSRSCFSTFFRIMRSVSRICSMHCINSWLKHFDARPHCRIAGADFYCRRKFNVTPVRREPSRRSTVTVIDFYCYLKRRSSDLHDFQWTKQPPPRKKFSFPWEILTPRLIHGSLVPPESSQSPKRHLDRFSRF